MRKNVADRAAIVSTAIATGRQVGWSDEAVVGYAVTALMKFDPSIGGQFATVLVRESLQSGGGSVAP